MAAAAKPLKGVFCRPKMLVVESNSGDIWCFSEPPDHLRGAGEPLAGQNHSCLQERRPTDNDRVTSDKHAERFCFRLLHGNGNNDRRIHCDHIGSPFSS